MIDILFLVGAVISVVGAIGVVSQRNPVYGAMGLLASFMGLALIFLLLHAPFVAVIQVAVYAGAILVLFLFVIMLLNLKSEEFGADPEPPARRRMALASALLFVLLAWSVAGAGLGALPFSQEMPPPDFGSTQAIGEALMGAWVLPFEVTSILIIVAIIGAVVLTKKKI